MSSLLSDVLFWLLLLYDYSWGSWTCLWARRRWPKCPAAWWASSTVAPPLSRRSSWYVLPVHVQCFRHWLGSGSGLDPDPDSDPMSSKLFSRRKMKKFHVWRALCFFNPDSNGSEDPVPDPDQGRPKLAPKKGLNEEISCLKSSLPGWRLFFEWRFWKKKKIFA